MKRPSWFLRLSAAGRDQERGQTRIPGFRWVITILPTLPSADNEYTPAQRRVIDARLAKARKGPYYGPFETADKAIAFLRKEIRTRKASRRKTA
jgi:hypothetical protein